MIRMSYYCPECAAMGDVQDDDYELSKFCYRCGLHHANIIYICDMHIDEFLNEISSMTESQFVQNFNRIQACAKDLKEKV